MNALVLYSHKHSNVVDRNECICICYSVVNKVENDINCDYFSCRLYSLQVASQMRKCTPLPGKISLH